MRHVFTKVTWSCVRTESGPACQLCVCEFRNPFAATCRLASLYTATKIEEVWFGAMLDEILEVAGSSCTDFLCSLTFSLLVSAPDVFASFSRVPVGPVGVGGVIDAYILLLAACTVSDRERRLLPPGREKATVVEHEMTLLRYMPWRSTSRCG